MWTLIRLFWLNSKLCGPWSDYSDWIANFSLCWGLTSQSTIFQSCRDGATASWVINQYFRGVKCLAQGHNTAAVGFEPPTSRSGVQHSTTEPPRSPNSKLCGPWSDYADWMAHRVDPDQTILTEQRTVWTLIRLCWLNGTPCGPWSDYSDWTVNCVDPE